MAVTTSGWTYALSTDPLINWPAQSLAVATKLEQRLPGGSGAGFLPFSMRSGEATVAGGGSVSITFPSGRFTQVPQILVAFESISTGLTGSCSAQPTSVTAGNLYNSSTGSRLIQFLAIQMTSSNARG